MNPRNTQVYSLGEAVEDVHQLSQAFRTFRFSLVETFGNALFDVAPQDGEADPVERRFGRGQLLEDLDAEPGFLNHSPDSAHLPLDTVEPGNKGLLLGRIQHTP